MKTLILTIALSAALLAQPNQLDLRQDPPVAVQSERVSSAYTGTSGATTYYYWVVTRYPIGFIVPTSPVVVGGASALGGGNSVALGWPAMTGASSYDVLRTTTNAAPSSCTCAVVLATTGTTLTDNGGALSAWPPGGLNSAGVAQAELQINNRDAGAPYITMAVRNAQRTLNYQLGILKNGPAPSYVPSGFIQPYSNAQGAMSCVDSTGTDCMATHPGPTNYCTDVGVGDAYACSLSPAITSYAVGNVYWFIAATENVGPASINFGPGVLAIKKPAGGVTTDLADGDIRSGQLVGVGFDGVNMQMQSALGNAPLGSAVLLQPTAGDAATPLANAISAAGVGGQVIIPPGTYQLAATFTIAASVELTCSTGAIIAFSGTSAGFLITGDDVTITGCTIDTTATSGARSMVVSGLRYRETDVRRKGAAGDATLNGTFELTSTATGHVIVRPFFDKVSTAILESGQGIIDNPVITKMRTGIWVSAADNVQINNLRVESVDGAFGGTAGLNGILVEGSSNITITNPIILASREHGIYLSGEQSTISIIGGNITNFCGFGIKATGLDSTHVLSSVIVDGTIVSTPNPAGACVNSSGILVDNVAHGQFSSIIAKNNTRAGVEILGAISDVTISAKATGNGSYGFYVSDLVGAISQLSIVNSSAYNNDTGNAAGGVYFYLAGGNANSNVFLSNVDSSSTVAGVQRYGFAFITASGSTLTGLYMDNMRAIGNQIGAYSIGTIAFRGTCDATVRGVRSYVPGLFDVADEFGICEKNVSNVYAWTALF